MITDTKQAITYQEETITIKHSGEDKQVQAHVAYQDGVSSGLAYCTPCTDDGDMRYTLTHIPTGLNIGGKTWARCSYTEIDAMKWLEQLLRIATWTEKEPQATADTMTLLGWASLGVWSSIEE